MERYSYPDENYIRSRQERMDSWSLNDWIKIDMKLKGSVLNHFLSCPKLVIIGALSGLLYPSSFNNTPWQNKHLSSRMLFMHTVFLLLLCGAFSYLLWFYRHCRSFTTAFHFLTMKYHKLLVCHKTLTGLACTPAADLVGVKVLMSGSSVLVNTSQFLHNSHHRNDYLHEKGMLYNLFLISWRPYCLQGKCIGCKMYYYYYLQLYVKHFLL
jgi:hypothetical protein